MSDVDKYTEADSHVSVTLQSSDETNENILRPQYLSEFQGQRQLK